MIIEIALGIVLGVILLFCLPFIVYVGIWLIGIALALAAVAGLVYFAAAAPEAFLVTVVIAGGFVGYAYWERRKIAKKEQPPPDIITR